MTVSPVAFGVIHDVELLVPQNSSNYTVTMFFFFFLISPPFTSVALSRFFSPGLRTAESLVYLGFSVLILLCFILFMFYYFY